MNRPSGSWISSGMATGSQSCSRANAELGAGVEQRAEQQRRRYRGHRRQPPRDHADREAEQAEPGERGPSTRPLEKTVLEQIGERGGGDLDPAELHPVRT